MRRVLVTGATGFIGRPLCAKLAVSGWLVRSAVRRQPAESFLPAGTETAVIPGVGPGTDWEEALDGVDAVVHLAARVHVMKDAAADPLASYREVNAAGTARLAEAAAAAGVRRFVFMSTVKVNGKGGELPYRETDEPAPSDPYGLSKAEGEAALRAAARPGGLEPVILRPPLVYGPGVKANFLSLLRLASTGLPLPLGGIRNTRSLIYAENLVDAVLLCLEGPEADGRTYMVSDGTTVSTTELVRMMTVALGKKPRLTPFPSGPARLFAGLIGAGPALGRLTGSLCVDSAAIRRELGWTPPFTMEQGLARTAAWYLEKRGR